MTIRARLSILFAAALLAAACGTRAPAGDSPGPAIVRLDPADVTALAELLRMEDLRVLDTLLVSRHLGSTNAEVRARAALAAGRLNDSGATPLLLRALADADAGVRERTAFALGELGDSAVHVLRALGRVALHDRADVALEAAAALGRIGTEAARPFLDSLITQPRVPRSVRGEALLVAFRLPRNPQTLSHIAALTQHEDAEIRWRAAYALARAGAPAGVTALLPLMRDPDARVRANAVRLLRAPVADSAGLRADALAALLAAAADSQPHVRVNAVSLLPAYRENARVTPALVARLGDVDVNAAVAAAAALGATGDAAAAPALHAAAADSRLPDGLRAAALMSWLRVDSIAAVPFAAAWADSSRWIVRLYAARALARLPWERSAPPLEKLARDDHPLVATEALNAIRSAADSTADIRRIFIERLNTANPAIRAAAANGLARGGAAADFDLLLQAYDVARRDSVRDAAVAVVNALGRLARAGVPVQPTFFLRFGGDGPPADPVLHRAIIERIGDPPASWMPPRDTASPRPLEFYTDAVRNYLAPVLGGAAAPRVIIGTPHGDIVLELAAAAAPLTVHNFITLIERGYYAGTRWHRVVPNFVIQDGDPTGTGSGGPGYRIRDEINSWRYERGALGMAHSGPNTGGAQYFITHSPTPHLDGLHTVFGRVIAGMDAVDRVAQDDPIIGMRVVR